MIAFLLNLPYTVLGLIAALISIPDSIHFSKQPYAIIIACKKFWWRTGFNKYTRAMAIGHVVLLGPHLEKNDLKHELIHIEQHAKVPLLHPLFYYLETFRKGYRKNKYEVEAYEKAGNIYIERKN